MANKKRLSVEKTYNKISKLRKLQTEIEDQLKGLGKMMVRGKSLGSMDNNYVLYNIAMFKTMIKECNEMFPEGDKRAKLISDTVGEDVQDQLTSMREYLRLNIKKKDVRDRIERLEDYMDNIPKAEKDLYRLEKAVENVDERDLTEEE